MVVISLETALQKYQQGQLTEAGSMYRQILAQDPKNLDALRMSSIMAEQQGELPQAMDFARQLIALKPRSVEYYLHLANLLMSANEPDEATAWLEKGLKLDRRNVDVHLLLGDAAQQKREYEGALKHYQKALQVDRSIPDVYNNMANTHLALGNLEAAMELYRKAISLNPNYTEAYFNLGNALRQFGNLPEAIAAYQKAMELSPHFYQAYSMLGLVAKNMNNYEHAEAFYRQALEIQPGDASTLSNLAIALAEQDRIDEAMQVFTDLAAQHPHHPDVLSDFALTINSKGYQERAMSIYEALARQNPHHPNQQLNHALSLPVVYQHAQDLAHWRQRYADGLETLLHQQLNQLRPHKVGAFSGSSFYLAYQGGDDKALQCKMAQVYQKILPIPPEKTTARPVNTKMRIGFISGHLSPKHTIGKLMYGIMARLSREKYDIHIFSVPSKHAFLGNLKIHADDHVHLLPYPSLMQSWEALHAANLDVLFYSDIGMDPFTYLLAHYRLAPVQCVTWGHPVTTGIPTIDYFISSKLLEPENAQDHYSEELVQLSRLPVYYYRPKLSSTTSNRETFGWTDTQHIYLCPQSLYKFHPDFDALIGQILRQDPSGVLVMLARGTSPVPDKLKQRFQKTIPDVADRVQWLPELSREDFLHLMCCADVMLDPMHFGGGNTTYEALALGVPIVTWPSAYMRGRVTAACYQQMGFTRLIAESAEEYVTLALKVGMDAQFREACRTEILTKNQALYEDEQVIQELEAFFLNALARQKGELAHD
jgi:protein O-GlcNAc transferase